MKSLFSRETNKQKNPNFFENIPTPVQDATAIKHDFAYFWFFSKSEG